VLSSKSCRKNHHLKLGSAPAVVTVSGARNGSEIEIAKIVDNFARICAAGTTLKRCRGKIFVSKRVLNLVESHRSRLHRRIEGTPFERKFEMRTAAVEFLAAGRERRAGSVVHPQRTGSGPGGILVLPATAVQRLIHRSPHKRPFALVGRWTVFLNNA